MVRTNLRNKSWVTNRIELKNCWSKSIGDFLVVGRVDLVPDEQDDDERQAGDDGDEESLPREHPRPHEGLV